MTETTFSVRTADGVTILAEVRQLYVDANEARIDAEAALAEARKALAALDRMSRGVDWCDQDEQARRWSAARRALEQQTGS